jgi:hypothetical protein
MKKKSLSVLIALSLAVTTALPAASVFADTTTPVVTAAASTTVAPASTYGVEYEAHVQSIGWQSPVTVTGDQTDVTNVTQAGTTGQSKRIEALKITGTNLPAGASIIYQTHVQSIGWQSAVTETGNVAVDSAPQAGTTGQSKRVEALKITLAGLPGYAVKYQAHVQSIGWQAPVTVNNGTDISDATIAGTTGLSKRVEALKIEIVKTDAEKTAEVTAINAVAQAQASKATADITAATTAVQAVLDTTENAALTAQIAAITANTKITVSSVTATAANTIQVKLSSAPADTSKVTFATTNGGTPVTTTTTWDATNTVATLTASSNFADGTYAVDVNNNGTDLGSNNVTITDQAVAKITITSSTLSVNPSTGVGYATYKVYDQYGADITNTILGNDITWTPGVGTLDTTNTKNGTIVINPVTVNGNVTTPLSAYTSAVINGYDTDDYVTTSATLNVSESTGVLSNITLNKLTSPNNDDFNAGDSSGLWYIDYTALDASGNSTNNYTLVNAGIQSVNVGSFLTLTSGTNNGVEQDPNDSTKAVIPVQINAANAGEVTTDMQIPITVLTTGGKASTLTVTLKKAAAVSSFTLQAPTQTVSSGQTVNIPYTAYDQNGVALNKYTDFVSANGTPLVNITCSGGTAKFVRNADGTAAVQVVFNAVTQTQTAYLQSNVIATGKSSSLNVSVQKATSANALAVDTTNGKQFFQSGATLGVDFGYNNGGLTLQDQYGRAIDVTDQDTTSYPYYKAVVKSSNSAVIGLNAYNADTKVKGALNPASVDVYGDNEVDLTAGTAGTATVTYEIYQVTGAGAQTDTGIGKSVQYTVLSDSQITGYKLDSVANPIDMVITTGTANTTDKAGDYAAAPTVWGTTASGVKVRVNPAYVLSATLTGSDFSFDTTGAANTTATGGATSFDVYAKTLSNSTSTGSSTTLTVAVQDSTGAIYTPTTPINSTTAAPAISSVGFSASNQKGTTGISVSGSTVTVKAADYANLNGMISKFDPTNGLSAGEGAVYFYGNDQFGTEDADLSLFTLSGVILANGTTSAVTAGSAKLTGSSVVTLTGNKLAISGAAPTAGDQFVLTAVGNGGKVSSVTIVFN